MTKNDFLESNQLSTHPQIKDYKTQRQQRHALLILSTSFLHHLWYLDKMP